MPDPHSVTTVSSEAEAEMICDRLLADGIHAIVRRAIGLPQFGSSGAHDVLVDPDDVERARALLDSEEGTFSDEELTRLSEEAGRESER